MIYLQELEFDFEIDDDPISFSHVIDSSNSNKWIDIIKDELKLIEKIKFKNLLKYIKISKELNVDGFLRLMRLKL